MADWQPTPEHSRAIDPTQSGSVDQGGVGIFYEVYDLEPDVQRETLLFVPPWSVVHSRTWKAQIGYFARHYRVVVYDPRGNGKSDKPTTPALYSEDENAKDIGAVLDATRTERALLVAYSKGSQRSIKFAADHPTRVGAIVFIAAATALRPEREDYIRRSMELLQMEDVPDEHLAGIKSFNHRAWQRDPRHYRDFLVGFFEGFFEPHSSKPMEDCLAWGLDTSPDALAASHLGPQYFGDETRALISRLQCPTFVIHGADDIVTPLEEGEALATALGCGIEVVPETGHGLVARRPVEVNLAIRDFLDARFDRRPKPRARRGGGPKKALFVCSPIGLGHAQRDVAIARELRRLDPDVQIDWLAQDPVTRVLAAEGETIHPASRALASESRHIESESAEHDLHCFHAIRRMDEIMINNFMVFHSVTHGGDYDLLIGDEAWEVDYYLHENPNEKRAPYVWLTDFVGYLPMEDGGDHEAFLTADDNAQMIGHIRDHPEVRDRAIFVGNPEDIVSRTFGPELPWIREWSEKNYSFAGYITGFDPDALGGRDALRSELGYRPDQKVCIVSVGGSGVGRHLIERIIAAYPQAKKLEPALRMIVVAGPRIDPNELPRVEGLEVVPYVHNLYRHLGACDLAVVQGGLTTAMELTANRRPFLYFPLKHHFEQSVHVRHRLDNYGAGRCMDYDTATPEIIAAAIAAEIGREVSYRPVETDGARRAAARILELL